MQSCALRIFYECGAIVQHSVLAGRFPVNEKPIKSKLYSFLNLKQHWMSILATEAFKGEQTPLFNLPLFLCNEV